MKIVSFASYGCRLNRLPISLSPCLSVLLNCLFFCLSTPSLWSKPVVLSGEVFSGYRFDQSASQTFNDFFLERGEIGIQTPYSDQDGWSWGGELRLESLRSAGQNSLIGIDGDSLVLRVKRGWAKGQWKRGDFKVSARLGLSHDPWHEVIMWAYPLRGVGPTLGEREGFQETSDLGGALHIHWKKHSLVLSLQNGEGRRYSEQNKGKDFLAGINLNLYQSQTQQLYAHFAYRDGSRGPSSGQNHRAFTALWYQSQNLSLGLIGYSAWGINQRPSLEAQGLQTWVSYWLFPQKLNVFFGWEGFQYQLYQSADQLVGATPNDLITAVNLETKGARYQGGLSHILAQIRDPKQGLHYQIQMFERMEYQLPTNLQSPVFGIPSLAEQWRFSVSVAFTWGPMPLNEYTQLPPVPTL